MSDEIDDIELVRRCQSGDTAAYNELVTRYRGKVYGMIYNMVHHEQDAWDLAQDGFVKAWKSIDRFKGESAFYTWLYRIMTNVTIDWLRRKQVKAEREFDDAVSIQEVDVSSRLAPKAAVLPMERMEHREIGLRIEQAIATLTPEHRAVIVLKEMEGHSYQEIAEMTGSSIGTVMSRLFYARKKLQALLKDLYEQV